MAARNSHILASCSRAMLRALRYSSSAASKCPCRSNNWPLFRYSSASSQRRTMGTAADVQWMGTEASDPGWRRCANNGRLSDERNRRGRLIPLIR